MPGRRSLNLDLICCRDATVASWNALWTRCADGVLSLAPRVWWAVLWQPLLKGDYIDAQWGYNRPSLRLVPQDALRPAWDALASFGAMWGGLAHKRRSLGQHHHPWVP